MTADQLAKAKKYVESDRHITREMAQTWLAEINRLRLALEGVGEWLETDEPEEAAKQVNAALGREGPKR